MSILKGAIRLLELGYSPVPIAELKTKRPAVAWAERQTKPYNKAEATRAFASAQGIAVVCGAVSGGLEVIDVDTKYDLTGTLFERLEAAIREADPELFDQLTIQRSQSGGYHLWYRCATVEGNKKLAMRPASPDELQAHNAKNAPAAPITDANRLPLVLIETRGEAGYILVAPTPGYKFQQRNPADVAHITPAQRRALLEVCRGFNEVETKAAPTPTPHQPAMPTRVSFEERAGDAYNDSHSVLDVLRGYGWTEVRATYDRKNGDAGVQILRPGKSDHEASGIAYPHKNICVIHSTSTPLPTGEKLTPFAIFAHYECGGDFADAARKLGAMGFGTQAKAQPAPTPVSPLRSGQQQQQHGEPTASAKQDRSETNSLESNPHFRLLGFDKTESGVQAFYFFQKGANTLLRLTAASMSKYNLMALAPLDWWESEFGGNGKRAKLDLDAAVNWIIQASMLKGHFREKYIRGKGAWMDAGRVVVHTGGGLIVDGSAMPFHALKTRYIYESSEELNISTNDPLPTSEAKKLLDICGLLNWDRGVNSSLLAGWCVVAPVCGALPWRPHIWLTGAAGTGKSWVFKNILRRLLGETALDAQGNTSEAGLRQMLGCDAVPVVFDEAEAEDRDAQARMALVMALMRAASSEDGGRIIKGGKDGAAKQYTIRACFAYASIAVQLQQQSDRSRVTVLEFRALTNDKERRARFEQLEALYRSTITDEWVRRLQARTIKMLPTILQNAKTLNVAVQSVLGSQRTADQLSILLAGAVSLVSDALLTPEEALVLVRDEDWSAERGLNATRDEVRLLSKLSEEVVRVGQNERSIGELILCAAHISTDSQIGDAAANDALKRCGIKVVVTTATSDVFSPTEVVTEVFVSDSAAWIKKTLRDTAWANDHRNILKRLEGAREITATRFAGIATRAIALPIKLFTQD